MTKREKWAATGPADRAFVYAGLQRVLEMVADSPYLPLSRKDAVAAAMEALAEEAGDKSPLEGGN